MPKKKPALPPIRIQLRAIILPKDETIQVYALNHPDAASMFPDPTVLPLKDGVTLNANRLASRLATPGVPQQRWTEVARNLMLFVDSRTVVVDQYVWADRVDHA